MTQQQQKAIKMRQNVLQEIKRFSEYIHRGSIDISELKVRLETAELLYDKFVESRDIIADTDEQLGPSQEEFEAIYYSSISQARKLISENELVKFAPSNEQAQNNRIRLPKLNIPIFEGSYENWTHFQDIFNSLINSNTSISPIEKFHYLQSSLKGDAAKVIQSLEVTEANYNIAWKLLNERFGKKRLIILNHIKAIFDLPNPGSQLSIQQLHDNLQGHLRTLKTLGQPTDHWTMILIHLVLSKLDNTNRREWENFTFETELPTTDQLFSFLSKRAQIAENLYNQPNNSKYGWHKTPSYKIQKSSTFISTNNMRFCKICKTEEHPLFKCQKFEKLSASQRIDQIKRIKHCLNCLKGGHYSSECKSSKCRKCGKTHNTLLHIDATQKVDKTNNENQMVNNEVSEDSILSMTCNNVQTQIILPTALIKIIDDNNVPHLAHALLDTGSQSNFISHDLCTKLNLKLQNYKLQISGLNGVVSTTTAKCNLTIASQDESYRNKVEFFTIPKITENSSFSIFSSNYIKIPKDILLADPDFNKSKQIDVLLGAPLFFEILLKEQIVLGSQLPVLQNTLLGWVIAGKMYYPNKTTKQRYDYNYLCTSQIATLNTQMEKFWKIEEMPQGKHRSQEEEECEKHFIENTKRDAEGRFIVKMPFKHNMEQLGDTRDIATKRLQSIEKKFMKNTELKSNYIQFLNEYEDLGHMTKLSEDQIQPKTYILPHHPVVRQESLTTKLRVVFDASAKPNSGFSLNEMQLTGPVIQNDIFTILINFRTNPIALLADVEKMYRQIWIDPSQRHLQQILWRRNETEPINYYQLNTVTYGTRSAPYLAIRCLSELAKQNKITYPKASEIIETNFYVDDLVSGAKDISEALKLYEDLTKIFDQAKMKLRKWASNNKEVLMFINKSTSTNTDPVYVCDKNDMKTLGINWNSQTDCFQYTLNYNHNGHLVTKRKILSIISQIYDPLGLISPITIIAKCLMQRLWRAKLEWDEPVPQSLYKEWCNFKQGINNVNKISISRFMLCKSPNLIELHGFSDASERAYAASVYLKSSNNQDCVVHLVCAKTKVTPLKSFTIPRLELCGALLLAKLINNVKQAILLNINKITLWTDSTIVLNWIQTPPHLLKTFVSNRVQEIQDLTTGNQWRHVPTKCNPADIASRGVYGTNLQDVNLWWHGPAWLKEHEDFWPILAIEDKSVDSTELKITEHCHLINEESTILQRFSDLNKLIRITAYMLRFITNSRNTQERLQGPLTFNELNDSFHKILFIVQGESFKEDIEKLKKQQELNKKSKLCSLNPFIDDKGLLRAGGRVQNSEFEMEKKHPIILDAKHHFTRLLFEREHKKYLHIGPQTLLYHIRERYWPIGGRNLSKQVWRRCIQCFKVKPRAIQNIMGNLPATRLQPSFPFVITGVDYAGPFRIKQKRGRGAKLTKCYICLFICFTTRAIHLELVSELTTAAFIMALRRFAARRGKPKIIYSDNGTNFVGANNKLHELGKFLNSYTSDIIEASAQDEINWKFIPPYSPHFGGLWEAGVKSTKAHIYRVIGTTNLTFEEFNTLLNQIEAVLNSRPLSVMSTNIEDAIPLTPAHFLIGRPLTSVIDPNVQFKKENRLTCYEKIQKMVQHFWERWSKEYVSEMQQRQRWKSKQTNISTGTVVLVKEDNLPPLCWVLGKVQDIHPGKDGVVRVVTIKTKNGLYKRAVTKLCPLPLND